MIKLTQNEILKILLKKKLFLILLLLLIFVSLFSYGQQFAYERTVQQFEAETGEMDFDWRVLASQRLEDLESRSDNEFIPEGVRASFDREIQQLSYFIDNDINPITPTAFGFNAEFAEQGIGLFIPLLVVILAADLVSGEFSKKTAKMLLTRAVPRWKILLSKYLALLMMTTLLIFMVAVLSTLVSFLFFGELGAGEPVITGFSVFEGTLVSDSTILISRFQFSVLVYSLVWFVSVIIASITLLVSVAVESSSSAIGILMASIIGGQFLQFFLADWELVKYFFVTNLDLPSYLTGSYQPVEGMNLSFSILTLAAWGGLSLLISFILFNRRDVLV
ncbi:ABC transporter, permease protein [Alkalibacterium sp. AK22]|uniref:ABC transporter permease n=1 Tax=Alkalibacterium sp. AK22 TaxID=1229520 RepID=UPI00045027CB|nr:ABC transporter permease [Alkalibacterium sp. AK22]EXJ23074.1 ABC transporter, permease protein [Alkalibacterium sp. AK22]